MLVVADASPLIALADVGRLDLLGLVYGEVIVPPAVYHEAFVRRPRPASSWLRVQAPSAGAAAAASLAALGAGEREAITLALELGADLLLVDDRDARSAALALGLPIAGTMAALLRAKAAGHLPAVRPVLGALIANGFHVDDKLRAAVLRAAGE